MTPNLLLTIQLINSAGVPISYKQIYPHSLVQAFIGLLCCQFFNQNKSITDIDNSNQTIYPDWSNFGITANANEDTKGIVAGTDATAVAITDYKLGARIPHGTGSGQLQYAAMQLLTSYTQSGSDAYFEIRRTLTNNSGATITLKEVAIYARFADAFRCCIERTLVDQPIANTNGATLTYKILKSI